MQDWCLVEPDFRKGQKELSLDHEGNTTFNIT